MDAETLKIILDLKEQVVLYERATADLLIFIMSKNTGYRTYKLNNRIFNDLHEAILKLKENSSQNTQSCND
jgi:hypothetical protein